MWLSGKNKSFYIPDYTNELKKKSIGEQKQWSQNPKWFMTVNNFWVLYRVWPFHRKYIQTMGENCGK